MLRGPANVRDMWERVGAWFDEFLKPGREAATSPQP